MPSNYPTMNNNNYSTANKPVPTAIQPSATEIYPNSTNNYYTNYTTNQHQLTTSNATIPSYAHFNYNLPVQTQNDYILNHLTAHMDQPNYHQMHFGQQTQLREDLGRNSYDSPSSSSPEFIASFTDNLQYGAGFNEDFHMAGHNQPNDLMSEMIWTQSSSVIDESEGSLSPDLAEL